MPSFFYDLVNVPDPRPSKAHPDHRAHRKKYERESPHFNDKELLHKGGVLALLGLIAFLPWQKAYAKHREEHHPERSDKNQKDRKGKKKHDRDEGRRDGRDRDGRGSYDDSDIRDGMDSRRKSMGYYDDFTPRGGRDVRSRSVGYEDRYDDRRRSGDHHRSSRRR